MNPELTSFIALQIQALFSGNEVAWPDTGNSEDIIFDALSSHGIAPIAYHYVTKSGLSTGWPISLINKLKEVSKQEAAVDLAREVELKKVLNMMDEKGTKSIKRLQSTF